MFLDYADIWYIFTTTCRHHSSDTQSWIWGFHSQEGNNVIDLSFMLVGKGAYIAKNEECNCDRHYKTQNIFQERLMHL